MLFDDEDVIELDSCKNPPECVSVPLKAHISLKDLWVPSELLPSRNKVLDSNRDKSHVFHILEKKNVESLSVYFEDSEKNLDSKGVLANSSAYTGINNKNSTSILDRLGSPELYQSDDKSDDYVNISEKKLDNDKQIKSFVRWKSKADLCVETKHNKESFSCNAVTEPPIADQKSESNNGKEYDYFLDIINSDESLCSDSFDNCSNTAATEFLMASRAPEKEECGNTADREKLSGEDSLVSSSNDKSDLVFEKPRCTISEQFENLSKVGTEQPLCNGVSKCPSKVVTELPIPFEKPVTECDKILQLLDERSTEKVSFVVEPEECQDYTVIELPIAYKRPVLEESKKKPKNQKKKKTTIKKNLQFELGDFLKIARPDGSDDFPKKDEFYDNLVRQGKCQPPETLSNKVDYPDFTKLENKEYFNSSINVLLKEESFQFQHQNCCVNLSEPSVLKEKKLESDPVTLNPVDEKPTTTTLVLENIFKEVTRENIKSFLSGYGELKDLSYKSGGKFLKVHAKIILDCDDIDWLIECINETEPFGASGGVVKCYKL